MSSSPLSWIRNSVSELDDADASWDGHVLSPLPEGAGLQACLGPAATLRGHLEHGETAFMNLRVWKVNFWELRGDTLVQYPPKMRGLGPTGVIYLRRVEAASVTAGWSSDSDAERGGQKELILTSTRGKVLRFRLGGAKNREPGEPSLEGWRKAICGLAPGGTSKKLAGGDFSLGDVFDGDRGSVGRNPMAAGSLVGEEAVTGIELRVKPGTLSEGRQESTASSDRASLSPRLDFLLMLAGIKKAQNNRGHGWQALCVTSSCAVYFRRFFVMTTFFATARSSLSVNSQAQNSTNKLCIPSLKLQDGEPRPCVLWAFSTVIPVLLFITQMAVYWWLYLFLANSNDAMARTHRGRMKYLVERCARNITFYLVYTILVGLVLAALIGLDPVTIVVYGMLVPLSNIPFSVLCIVYYAEVRRLRLVLKDFLFLMQQKPFAFDKVARAYFEMKGEWEDVQARLGPIASLMTAVFFVKVLEIILVFMYRGKSSIYSSFDRSIDDETDPNYMSDSQVITNEYTNAICNALALIPLIYVMVYSCISVNERVEEIDVQVGILLSTSAPAAPVGNEGMAEEGEDIMAALEKGKPAPAASSADLALNAANSLKFASIVERRPCEIELVGRKFTQEDVLGTVGIAFFVVVINFLGIADYLGG